jgi:hypothetical protein
MNLQVVAFFTGGKPIWVHLLRWLQLAVVTTAALRRLAPAPNWACE